MKAFKCVALVLLVLVTVIAAIGWSLRLMSMPSTPAVVGGTFLLVGSLYGLFEFNAWLIGRLNKLSDKIMSPEDK